MASTARTTIRRRLGVLIAGAVVLAALSVATAGAAVPRGPSGWAGLAGRRPRLGRPHQRPDPRSSGGAGPPPGHHRDGDRPQVLGPRGSNGPQLGPRLTAGRPADAPGGLTLTPGLPTDRRRRWRDCDVACRSRQARRASATATCPPIRVAVGGEYLATTSAMTDRKGVHQHGAHHPIPTSHSYSSPLRSRAGHRDAGGEWATRRRRGHRDLGRPGRRSGTRCDPWLRLRRRALPDHRRPRRHQDRGVGHHQPR
jgi:hypothetical protein